MDVLAAAATVIQLLQVTAQVSTALGKYVSAVKGAESSRSKLIDQITLISAATRAIESIVLNSPPSSRTPEQQAFLTEWFRSDGSPAQCKKELNDLLIWLHGEAGGEKKTRILKKLMWPLRENRIQTSIRVIREHMPYFHCILSIDNSNRIQEITSIITSEREHTAKRKLLEWLDGLDCTAKHESTREQRQRTTGEWLFNEHLYMQWRGCSFGLLWLSGKAGAGKSVLASTVIDSLSSGLADDETLAYFYCDFRNPRSTSTMEILRSLTTQLLWNSNIDWLSSFPELVMRNERGTGPPVNITTLSDLLRRAAKLHQRPMIVIDALDECEDLPKLLDALVKLDKACRLFVTSRPLHSTNGVLLARLSSISLNDRVDAVCKDMYFHISTELESRDRLKILSHDLRVEIRDALMKKADGMFRWVQCQLDRLNGCWSLGDLREVLDTLPTTLYDTYDRMLCAIDKMEFGGRVARRALVWLVTTLHPLALSQLAEALTISCDNPASDSTIATMRETDLIDICGSLVSFDEQTGIISLSHYSVKEYLTSDVADKNYFVHATRANFELATLSIYSIMFSIDKSDAHRRDLCKYALDTGLNHLAHCAPEDGDRLLELLFSFQNHVSDHRRSYATKWRYEVWITTISQLALYTIIRFGHVSMLRHYLDHQSIQAIQGANPLVYAALYRDVSCVQVLLDGGLDVNIEAIVPIDRGYMPSLSPLMAATRNHRYQEEVVTLLLAQGSTVPRNAIHSVLESNGMSFWKPFTIQILLQHGADAMLLEAGGKNCLHSLLRYRWVEPKHFNDVFEIARLLVGAGCNPAQLDDSGLSPTHLALESGAVQLIEWLVENGFRLPPDAVLHAVQWPFSETLLPMLRLLIENGIAVDVRDEGGSNALHGLIYYTASSFDEETEVAIKLLVAKGCDIDCLNHLGGTPLHIAAQRCKARGVEFLIDQGAQLPDDIVNYCVTLDPYHDNSFPTSLLVRLVTIHGASCQAQTTGDNALHCLLSVEVKEPFYSHPLRGNRWKKYCFLLGTAIENGHLSIARILLDRFAQSHADITLRVSDSGDAQGDTLLHRLCYKLQSRDGVTDTDFLDRVELLQQLGYDFAWHVNTLNNQGCTPLCIVLQHREHDHPEIVSYLLHSGARFSDMNPLFLDNFEWASDLPWYNDATEACQRTHARHKITFDDVDTVYHLLVDHCKLPVPAVRRIMDTAEYWAYAKVLRENIQSILTYSHEPITLPVMPSIDTRYWMPRRVIFSCKPLVMDYDASWLIELSIRRQNVEYAVPVDIRVETQSHPLELPRTAFKVWDEYTPAEQLNGRQRLVVEDLTCGDMLSLEFPTTQEFADGTELEFFQINTYFTMRAMDDSPSFSENR
ncbi:hypothetical protein BU15DRAFT_75996 [Melanogaster broomeanus]|nr:hypothetical protein BU15DRAFT_75996 [Melanogaster broomeanus]